MTRSDLLTILEVAFPDYNVADSPFHPVEPPAVVVGGSTRQLAQYGYGWQGDWEIVFIAGRPDDVDTWATCDAMQNEACDQLTNLPGWTNLAQVQPPDVRTVGGVDVLAFSFMFTDMNIHGACA